MRRPHKHLIPQRQEHITIRGLKRNQKSEPSRVLPCAMITLPEGLVSNRSLGSPEGFPSDGCRRPPPCQPAGNNGFELPSRRTDIVQRSPRQCFKLHQAGRQRENSVSRGAVCFGRSCRTTWWNPSKSSVSTSHVGHDRSTLASHLSPTTEGGPSCVTDAIEPIPPL